MEYVTRIVSTFFVVLFYVQGVVPQESSNSSLTCAPLPFGQCTTIILGFQGCTRFIREDTDNWKKLLTCYDDVKKTLPTCDNKVVAKFSQNVENAFKTTEKFFTKVSYSSDLTNDKNCLKVVRTVLYNWFRFTPDFLNDYGCRFLKIFVFVNVVTTQKPQCVPMVNKYVKALYSSSSCARMRIKNPSDSDVLNLHHGFVEFKNCVELYSNLPTCSGKSKLLQCVEERVKNKITNRNAKLLENGAIEIVAESDKELCENLELRNDFRQHIECFPKVFDLFNEVVNQDSGFFTKEGCEFLKFVDHFEIYRFIYVEDSEECCPLLKRYWTAMLKRMPCVEKYYSQLNMSSVSNVSSILIYMLALVTLLIFK